MQTLHLCGTEEESTLAITSSEVEIFPSEFSALDCKRITASSKIKFKLSVKFIWEYRYYLKKLICRHRYSSLFAYCITNKSAKCDSVSNNNTMVRLRDLESTRKLLIKCFPVSVSTMEFANDAEVILGVMDQSETLYVFKIENDAGEEHLSAHLLLLLRTESELMSNSLTLCWGPSFENFQQSDCLSTFLDESHKVLAVARGNRLELFNLDMARAALMEQYPEKFDCSLNASSSCIDVYSNELGCDWDQLASIGKSQSTGRLYYRWADDHTSAILAVALSNDASFVASAGTDGNVYVYSTRTHIMGSDFGKLEHIHTFLPHADQPVYGLIFIMGDNMDGITSNYLLTGGRFNREIRLWSLTDWSCAQTLRFLASTDSATHCQGDSESSSSVKSSQPSIIMQMDDSCRLLVASDITRRVLYIFELSLKPANEMNPSLGQGSVGFVSLSEFLLTTPCIMFALGKLKMEPDATAESHTSSFSQNASKPVTLELHSIHTRSLLNSTVTFCLPMLQPSRQHVATQQLSDNVLLNSETSIAHDDTLNLEDAVEAVEFTSERCNSTDVHVTEMDGVQRAVLLASLQRNPNERETWTDLEIDNDLPPLRPSDFSSLSPSRRSAQTPPLCSPSSQQSNLQVHEEEEQAPILHSSPSPTTEPPQAAIPSSVELVNISDIGSVDSLQSETELSTSIPVETELCVQNAMDPFEHTAHSVNSNSPPPQQHDALCTELNRLNQPDGSTNVERELSQLVMDPQYLTSSDATSAADPNALHGSLSVTALPATPQIDSVSGESVSPDEKTFTIVPFQPMEPESVALESSNLPLLAPSDSALPRQENDWSTTSNCSSSASSSMQHSYEEEVEVDLTEAVGQIGEGVFEIGLLGQGDETIQLPEQTSLESVTELLSVLVAESKERDAQMQLLLRNMERTEQQLERLTQTNTDLFERLNRISENMESNFESMQTASAPSNRTTKTTTNQVTVPDDPVDIQSSTQKLLGQLRTQQGDVASRFSKLESLISKHENKLNATSTHLAQLPKQLNDAILPALQDAIRTTFVKNLPRLTDPLQKAVQRAINECLRPVPSSITDGVLRTLRDKNFSDQVARATSRTMIDYRESLQQVLLPAMDRAISTLFNDLSTIFQSGTQHYIDELSKRTSSTRVDSAALAGTVIDQIIPKIEALLLSMNKAESQPERVVQPNAQYDRVPPPLSNRGAAATVPPPPLPLFKPSNIATQPESKIKPHPKTPKSNKKSSAKGQTVGLTPTQKSGGIENLCTPTAIAETNTPSQQLTQREEFARLLGQGQKLIRSGRLIEALELALVSTNQLLVLDICHDIDPYKLFNNDEQPLAQNILLSLIHQLSCADLGSDLELKLRYLEEAVFNLDKDDPTTIAHGPRIVGFLLRRVNAFLASSRSKLDAATLNRLTKLSRSLTWIYPNSATVIAPNT